MNGGFFPGKDVCHIHPLCRGIVGQLYATRYDIPNGKYAGNIGFIPFIHRNEAPLQVDIEGIGKQTLRVWRSANGNEDTVRLNRLQGLTFLYMD
ncbi:hypothetical protein SDC9_180567 [bioreactor metagenome]|uniref:Uncharacterized protein n=1 Tax=bioreactor metagenome TaxID=1076179 RepID=A0A645HAF0_9ZZZZ